MAIFGLVLLINEFVDLNQLNNSIFNENTESYQRENSTLKNPKNKKYSKIKNSIKNPKFNDENIESLDNESNGVLDVKDYKETPSFEDNKLVFTPNYEKPVLVTRKPKKRSNNLFEEEVGFKNSLDKTDDIKKALNFDLEDQSIENSFEEGLKSRNIEIDINDPESLPIPKILKSFIVSNKGNVASKEAFEDLAINSKNDIMLEIPNLNNLNDRFLSYVPTKNSRIIIEEFDISNTSYVLLLSSLLSQKVHIKTLPKVDITNLVTDNSALIMTDELTQEKGEYGAIYQNSEISEIKEIFEKSWNLAKDIDKKILNS